MYTPLKNAYKPIDNLRKTLNRYFRGHSTVEKSEDSGMPEAVKESVMGKEPNGSYYPNQLRNKAEKQSRFAKMMPGTKDGDPYFAPESLIGPQLQWT